MTLTVKQIEAARHGLQKERMGTEPGSISGSIHLERNRFKLRCTRRKEKLAGSESDSVIFPT
ncbi:hypothetical protein [Paracoccus methylarcula]|uniref:Uncharacterized protein n=1 Tax=Paracoccus methylarcula TaxID=72022 RepID=A0A422QVD2_9RHOB|nr:hypothetical protein [Paracoccus methylarcula]RNF33929.1 hypothetical protein A7A09_013505 [Paracoccus methylarcula]